MTTPANTWMCRQQLPPDNTEEGTIVILGRGGRALVEQLARLDPAWRERRRKRRQVVLWGLSLLSLVAAVLASGWRP